MSVDLVKTIKSSRHDVQDLYEKSGNHPKMHKRICDIQIKRIYQLVICCFILTTIYLAVYLIPSQGIKENPELEDNVVDELNVQDKIKGGLNAENGMSTQQVEPPYFISNINVKGYFWYI